MFAILSNCCKRMLRSGQKEMLQKDGGALPEKRQEGHEPDYAQWHDVRRAFGELDEEERMIVAFSVFGGYRSEEIGQMLDKNAATVRSKKCRALEKMRSALI